MIGLIFGETDFPKQILKKIKKKKKYLIIDLTKNKTFKKDKNSYSVSLGQFGKIIKILKRTNMNTKILNLIKILTKAPFIKEYFIVTDNESGQFDTIFSEKNNLTYKCGEASWSSG